MPSGGVPTTLIDYGTRSLVGVESRIRMTSHVRLMPGLRCRTRRWVAAAAALSVLAGFLVRGEAAGGPLQRRNASPARERVEARTASRPPAEMQWRRSSAATSARRDHNRRHVRQLRIARLTAGSRPLPSRSRAAGRGASRVNACGCAVSSRMPRSPSAASVTMRSRAAPEVAPALL